jgi:hypothetical protein
MKKYVLRAGAIAALASTALAMDPPEAPDPCTMIPSILCNEMPYLTNGTWIPGEYDWTPNRLPAAWINLRPGEYCFATGGNYRGLQPWWYENDDDPEYDAPGTWEECEAFQDLEAKLLESYGYGFRRLILNLPAGMVGGAQNMASAQWRGMPQWKRNLFTCFISDWLAERPDTQFEVYSAFEVNDPSSLCMENNSYAAHVTVIGTCTTDPEDHDGKMFYPCYGADTAYAPSPQSQYDVCLFHTNHSPWQHLGFTRVWLDWSNHHWDEFEEFAYCPLYAPGSHEPHFLGCEAIPVTATDPNYSLNMSRVRHAPAIAIDTYCRETDHDKSWDVSLEADTTELVVVLDHSDTIYFQINHMNDVLAWTQRGFVLGCQGVASIGANPSSTAVDLIEFMKRVYDFGELANRADFNGDGAVNSADQSDFNAAYAIYQGRTGCNWVHGDLSGDNYVGAADVLYFNSWKLYHNSHPNDPVTADLGSADPMDALTKP